MNFDPIDLFNSVRPDFFEKDHIRSLPVSEIYEEQILDLHAFSPDALAISCPAHITFGPYQGELAPLHAAVRLVDESWIPYYTPDAPVYCAMDGEQVVSFCLLDDFGTYQGLRIGAPGCVGTIPAYRKQGIGLKMIQNATAIFQARGYDLGYIHYTGVGRWYEKLGYRTLLRWNARGIIK